MSTKCDYSCKNNINSSYIKWLLEILGPVILGSKPCEIINISSKDIKGREKIKDIKSFFKDCSKISYEIINLNNDSIRILFINKEALNNALINKKCLSFLRFLGYPKEYSIDMYMQKLIEKLKTKDFPHEIGIFLGYPLKDVLGFMGYGKNELYTTCVWKIYGDPSISYEVCNSFLKDRAIMKEMINNNSISELRSVI